jgi:hypothetical protein
LKDWAVFLPGLAVIVNPGRRDVCMAEPFLDLGDVRFMIEGIGRGRGAQGVAKSSAQLNLDKIRHQAK